MTNNIATHVLEHLNDRVAVIVDKTTGARSVTYGDGATIPFGAFMAEEIHALAASFLLSPNSNVTAFDPKQLAGLIGALLARQSRMNGSVVDVLAKEFLHPDGTVNREKAEALIGRVLLQFGDDSVQEYETATVLFVSVSNLATKIIEDRRLGSYIEQSSRYVYYWQRDPVNNAWRYYREPRIMASPLAARYTELMDKCFATYVDLIEKLTTYYGQVKPLEEAEYAIRPDDKKKYKRAELNGDEEREFDRVYKTDLKTRACDTARIVLPASTMTNMAMVANGRTFEYLLKVLYASDVPEFTDIGARAHETLNKIIPQYVKRADPNGDAFLRELRLAGGRMAKTFPGVMDGDVRDEVGFIELPRIVADTTTAQASLLAAALYPHVRCSYAKLVETIGGSGRHLPGLIGVLAGERKTRRDRSPRGFEHGYPITVEVAGNFGIYRDLQRHRMLTMNRQNLTPYLGFTVPSDVEAVGMGGIVAALAAEIARLYGDIDVTLGADAAEYCVLFGHHLRFKIGMNLREAQHLLELRTIPQGHPDYRRICQKIANEIISRAPWLEETGLLEFVDHNSYDWARGASEARNSQKALERGVKLE
jgi:thymidylate synthase ThyX